MRLKALWDTSREAFSFVGSLLWFLLVIPVVLPLAWLARSPARPWVISGHRGRIYADNSAAVHRELVRQGQPVIWITEDPKLLASMRAQGLAVHRRNSLAARWSMIAAPVLIYSHGESDIDLFQILLRRCLGLRVYLNHCMNHVKAGYYHDPVLDGLTGIRRRIYEFAVADFDVLLASTASEKRNFELSFPHKKSAIRLGGGAHLDRFIELKARGLRTQDIVYFPTFRDDATGRAALEATLQALMNSAELQAWLAREDLRLRVGAHINTGAYAFAPSGRIEWLTPSEIVDAMCTTQGFISDYSGLLADALLLDIPVVFFPFDLDDYLKDRRLFHPYEKLAFGPMVRSVDELVALLTSGEWSNLAPWSEHRAAFRDEVIPSDEATHARASVAAIREELALRTKDEA